MAKKESGKFVTGLIVGVVLVFVLIVGISLLVGLGSNGKSIFSFFGQNKVAVIDILGEIAPGGGGLLTGGMNLDQIISDLEEVENNPEYDGVLIKIDSPGGTVVGSRSIVETIKSMKKPSVCWLGDTAASGAYWIASACNTIIADPLTITGSIGATASYLQYTGFFEKYGISYQQIVSGEYKDSGSPYRNLTTIEKEKLQYIVDESFKFFLEDVTANRHLTKDQIEKVKTGDIFLAKDALELGLVDKLGTLKDARDLFKQILKKEPVFVPLKHQASLF